MERETLLLVYGINLNMADGSVGLPDGATYPYLDTSDPNNIDTTWNLPNIRANRELVVHSFVRKAARISLLRNTEFVLHLYSVLDSVFSFYSEDSYKAREHLSMYLKGFSCYSFDKNNGEDPTTPELLEVISPSENFANIDCDTERHLNRLVFTISLKQFLGDYAGNAGGLSPRILHKGTFATSSTEPVPTLSGIRAYVCKGERLLDSPLSVKDSDILPAVMLSTWCTRTSRTYFMAYTASLAKAMNAVFSLVKARKGLSFKPTDKLYTLFPLIQDVGVLLGDSSGNPLNIHVPRYINFLMTVGHLGPLTPHLLECHNADPRCSPRDLLFPSGREQYLQTMTRLATTSLRDLLDSPSMEFYDSSDAGTSYLAKVERGNTYFDTSVDPSLFKLFLSLSMQSMTNTLVAAYRKRKDIPVYYQKDRAKPETKSTSDKRRRGPRDPLKIPCTLHSTKDNNNEEIPVFIYLVRSKGVTYFGLPWMFLRDNLKVSAYPPNPKYVYNRIPSCVDPKTYKILVSGNITGMYAQTYTHAREGYCYNFQCMGSDTCDLSFERDHLHKWVKVFKNTPYLFSLSGLLKLPPDAWDDGIDPLKACSELRYLLIKLENAPYSELRTSSIVYANRLDASKHKKELDEAKREGRIKEGVDPTFKVSPTDSRLSFTAEEDAAILALYHVGMKPPVRLELLRKCAGHTWSSIVGRAKLLCDVLMSEGVTDPTKLPYIRATPRIKKLIEEMNR
jgi:hypothetical protein